MKCLSAFRKAALEEMTLTAKNDPLKFEAAKTTEGCGPAVEESCGRLHFQCSPPGGPKKDGRRRRNCLGSKGKMIHDPGPGGQPL